MYVIRSCNMDMRDLPDNMYAQSLRAVGPRTEVSGKLQVPMSQLCMYVICNTFLLSCAQAKS